MIHFSRLSARLLLILGLVCVARDARAEQRYKAEAERRNKKASLQYKEGRYETALQLYQSAYDLFPDPRYMYNIGLAREKTFAFEACVVAFTMFLSETEQDGDAMNRESARARLQGCKDKTRVAVRFTSVPTNAAVFVEDAGEKVLRGRTPQDVKLGLGSHSVTVELPGYLNSSRSIEVTAGQKAQEDFVLEKLSTLRIEVDPSGARVRIDDSPWRTAPVKEQVQAGEHRIRVEKAGYIPTDRIVQVQSGEQVSLVLPLRPRPVTQDLTTRSNVPGCLEFRIDGKAHSCPPGLVTLNPGEHSFAMRAEGRRPLMQTVRVPQREKATLHFTMTPVRSRRSTIALWTIAGASGATFVAGSVFGTMALVDQRRFRDMPTLALHERGENRAELADFFWVSTVALVAGGALYYYLSATSPSSVRID